MTTLRLKNDNEIEAWKVMSTKINKDLEGQDGFISRDSVRKEDGLIYCILKWESKAQQEKFMANLAAREDIASTMMMENFAQIVDVDSMTQEHFEVL